MTFRPRRVNRLLGTQLSDREQRAVLERVGLEAEAAMPGDLVTVAVEPRPIVVEPDPGEAITALVPTWRRDIVIEADIAEEIARVRGYDQVPAVLPHTPSPPWRPSPLAVRNAVRETLLGAGLSEVVTFALVSPELLETFALRAPVPSVDDDAPGGEAIQVTNPLSRDHSVLRQGLIGSLVGVVATNVRHGREDVAVFEIGKGYGKADGRTGEWWRLGLALTGAAEPPAWNRPARTYDVDDAKGLIELVCERLGFGLPVYVAETDEPILHPGRALRAAAGPPDAPALLAVAGELHPDVVARRELRAGRVVVAEAAIAGLGEGGLRDVRAVPPSRYPAVERDLAVVVPEERPAGSVVDAIRRSAGELLRSVVLFDIYRGAPLRPDEKSLAHRLTFAADRTLTEEEVDEVVGRITAALERELGARLRA